MGQKIWGVLAAYEGSWVAVDDDGKVAAQAGSLQELTRLAKGATARLTLLYAAPDAAPEHAVRS